MNMANGAAPKAPPRESAGPTGRGTNWLRVQAINVARHAEALRPFRRDEFGPGAPAPTEAHIKAVNDLLAELHGNLSPAVARVRIASARAAGKSTTENIQRLNSLKERAHAGVLAVERVWDFYFELFGQRQGAFANWLLSCDRIALDCYQHAYVGLGAARSIPTPPPFSYMRTGFSPATFRRSLRLRRLGFKKNPFPLIMLPYHRLVNPWTLGAILHEVSHNLQNDLGLEKLVPRRLGTALLRAGLGRDVARTWVRWNREFYADVSGLLLGGPAIATSLMDIIGRGPRTVLAFRATGPHPTPYIRAFVSTELLRRLGFNEHASQYDELWRRAYPDPTRGTIPPRMLSTMKEAIRIAVDVTCFQPFEPLGNKSLAQVIRFGQKEQAMIEEAAGRIANGTDPGIVPERFLIGASRVALSRQLAPPAEITRAFYSELSRR
ncbi:MAG TPA: hypothetical protein VNC50_21465 [Planctomycetia bacterium]|nr:hypothetical protein [Planctomycetia bacterium]